MESYNDTKYPFSHPQHWNDLIKGQEWDDGEFRLLGIIDPFSGFLYNNEAALPILALRIGSKACSFRLQVDETIDDLIKRLQFARTTINESSSEKTGPKSSRA